MIFSYSQISHFLRCPRSYRYRYLEGWQEKETRAGMIFGRCFEKALAAFFLGQDCGATLLEEWTSYRDAGLGFKNGENWDRLYRQGMHLLELFARDSRIRIADPKQNLQTKIERELLHGNKFVAYLDAIGELDGTIGDRLEDHVFPLRGRACRDPVTRPATALLLVAHGHFGSRIRGIHSQKPSRNPVPANLHL
jgi:hypothetical protein